eukprot:GHVL01036168.1.p1 GENE.GHVL01036168.1~~GHVL01036168.1.p1  ORF type:complete len:303 (+),score=51.18 GHVL01036168.1:56-964(+)
MAKVFERFFLSGRECCCTLCGRSDQRGRGMQRRSNGPPIRPGDEDEESLNIFFGNKGSRPALKHRKYSTEVDDEKSSPSSRDAMSPQRIGSVTGSRRPSSSSSSSSESSSSESSVEVKKPPKPKSKSLEPTATNKERAQSLMPRTARDSSSGSIIAPQHQVKAAASLGNSAHRASVSVAQMRKNRLEECANGLHGYLLKQSPSALKGFEKRYFKVVEDEDGWTLAYWVNYDESCRLVSVRKGTIPLSQVKDIKKHTGHEKQFMIERLDAGELRKYVLKAPDADAREAWVKGLKDMLKETPQS